MHGLLAQFHSRILFCIRRSTRQISVNICLICCATAGPYLVTAYGVSGDSVYTIDINIMDLQYEFGLRNYENPHIVTYP